MASPATIMFAEEHQQNKQEYIEADKRLTGDTGELLTPEKIMLGTAIKRKELCYLGVCDACTGGHAMSPLLLFWK